MPTEMPVEAWMLIGRIVAPFGLRGEMKVDLHTDFPDRFQELERIYLGPGKVERRVERARRHKGQVLLTLAGVETPEQVEALGKPEIFVPRAEAKPLPKGHFYLEDVIGMRVRTTGGEPVGEITEVIRTGGNEVFVVSGGRNAVLIPAIKDAIETLDLENRTVTVEPWVLPEEE